MVLSPEGLVADITGIWPLVRVRPLVDQEVVGFGKVAAAELADKLFLCLGRQSASAGLWGREFVNIQEGYEACWSRVVRRSLCCCTGHAQVFGLQMVLLGGCSCQVGKVKAGLVLGDLQQSH